MNFGRYLFPAKALGINLRNYFIATLNPLESLRLAKDKESVKRLFWANGILTPKTFSFIQNSADLEYFNSRGCPDEFVIKPNSGLGGSGIVLLKKSGDSFYDPAGKAYSINNIIMHIKKILDGEFSGYIERDSALIEERIYPSASINFGNLSGLPDIRIFCLNYKPVMAMMRYGTIESRGRANLSAGALGMALDMNDGSILHIRSKGGGKTITSEEFGIPKNFHLPKWNEMKEIAAKASFLSGLGVAGADIILDVQDRVMALEINGRPGLEIQNINHRSLLESDELFYDDF